MWLTAAAAKREPAEVAPTVVTTRPSSTLHVVGRASLVSLGAFGLWRASVSQRIRKAIAILMAGVRASSAVC